MTVLLVHGVPATSRLWRPILARIGRAEVATVDLRGVAAVPPPGWAARKDNDEAGRRMATRMGAERLPLAARHFRPCEAPDRAVAAFARLWMRAGWRWHTIVTQPAVG